MGRQRVTDQQAAFLSGVNTVSDPAFLRQDQARQMVNFRLSSYGAALKRLGTALTTSSAITTQSSVIGGIYWAKQGKVYAFASATNSLTVHAYRASYDLPATWSDLGACPQWRPVIFSDGSTEVLYVAGDSSTAVQKIATDGTTISALGASTAKVKGLVVYNDRLWGWSGNHLYFSNLSSASGSTGGDSIGNASAGGGEIIVNTFGNSDIVTCAVVNGSLLIFHKLGVSVLTGWGQDDIAVQPQALSSQIGMGNASQDGLCVANTLTAGDLAFFVTPLGMYVTNGASLDPVGTPDKPDPIYPLIAALGTSSAVPGTLASIRVTLNRTMSELWVDTDATGGGVYVYHLVLRSWSGPFTGVYAYTGAAFIDGNFYTTVIDGAGNPRLWRAARNGAVTGVAYTECDVKMGSLGTTPVYLDSVTPTGGGNYTGGSAVSATLQLRRLFGQDRVFAKSWRWLNLVATLTSGDTAPVVACSTQLGGTNTQTLSSITSVEQTYYVSPGGMGPYIDVTITDAGTLGASQYAFATVQGNALGQR